MSKYNFEKISTYKQILQPSGNQKVPVVFHVSDELMPDQRTIDQLIAVASDEHVVEHVAAMTDVHEKIGRKNAAGTVVATKNHFLPQLLDTAPNCGMRLIATPFAEEDLSEKQIDELFKELVEEIPTKTYFGNFVPHKVVLDICKRGSRALLEHLGQETNQVGSIHSEGNMFENEKISNKDLFAALPRLFYRFGQFRLGILGAAGNHFVDLMKVTDLLDEETAKKFNLKKGQYLFWIHTGSGLFGQYASYFYTPKIKEHFSQRAVLELGRTFFLNDKIDWHKQLEIDIPRYKNKSEFFSIDADTALGRNYFVAHNSAGNMGFANRTMIQHNMEKTVKKLLGKNKSLDLIYDMSHIYAKKENHFGQDLIIHRQNTTRAFGPTRMKGTKFAETGEPVFMPSSMSTPAYFGVGTNENESAFFSAAHGTGKSKTKTSEVPKDKKELFKKMKGRGVRLYNAASPGVIEQDAAHYKDPEMAIAGLKENKVMKPVAKMMPIAVLMY